MLQEYYHEEYNGLNNKEIEEMQLRMFQLIKSEKVYVLLNSNDQILSFCSIIDPDIGILFTKNDSRNKGCAKMILSYCSNLLLQRNGKVFLMTDQDKLESNLVSAKVGFESFYKYKMVEINCG